MAEISADTGADADLAEDDLGGTDESLRTCAATGARRAKAGMVRFVIGPDHRPVPDLEEKLPGRGIWLSADRHVIHTACRKNVFAKRARRPVEVDDTLADRLDGLLARRCQRWLELARRAGIAVGGFDEVRRGLDAKGASGGLVLVARDAGAGGRESMIRQAQGLLVSAALDADEIGAVFGRARVAHVLVGAGGLRDGLGRDLKRLEGLRGTLREADENGTTLADRGH